MGAIDKSRLQQLQVYFCLFYIYKASLSVDNVIFHVSCVAFSKLFTFHKETGKGLPVDM